MSIEVFYLETSNGVSPYLKWEGKLDDTARAAARIRINRIRLGNFGGCKLIKGASGLYELRFKLGPGYRIYFGKVKDTVVIILCGGDKGSQHRDINKAKEYWKIYKDLSKKR